MQTTRNLPARERVFILSLVRHGFRVAKNRNEKKLKRRYGYITPSTKREDAEGIDFWVKLPNHSTFIPIQVTQRGTSLYKKYRRGEKIDLANAVTRSEDRLRTKREICRENGTAFVLVRDYDGERMDTNIAWGDRKALYNGVAVMQLA